MAIVFSADDATHGRELWSTNGQDGGARLLLDINPGAGSSDPRNFTRLANSNLVFSADDGIHGRELWTTDGTATGTFMLSDIRAGSDASSPDDFFALSGNQILFSAHDGVHGRELWSTDGTVAGTHLVADTDPGLYFGLPSHFVGLGNGLAAFTTYTPASGTLAAGTWVTDGTTAGTRPLVVPLQDGGAVATLGNGQALALNYDTNHGRELWLLDANGGISFLADLFPGTTTNPNTGITTVSSSSPHTFISLGEDHFLFVAQNRYANQTLWSYDHGTIGLVQDNSYQANGTLRLSEVDGLTSIGNGRALFASSNADGAVQLWVSDGTTAGTAPIVDFGPSARGQYGTDGFINGIVSLGDGRALFNAILLGVSHVYITDGSTAGTHLIADGLSVGSHNVVVEPQNGGGERILFTGVTDNTFAAGLWVTDGTLSGTHLSDGAGNPSFGPDEFTVVNPLPTAPQAPSVALAHDTGANGTDRITSDPTLIATASRSTDTLLYAVDGGERSTTAPVFARDGSADGVHTVTVTQKNLAGTLSSPTTITFTLDTTTPHPTIAQPGGRVETAAQTITGSVGASEAGASVALFEGTDLLGTTIAGADGSWSVPITLDGFGTHTLTATATDLAGNSGTSAGVTLVFDNPVAELFGDFVTDAASPAGQLYQLYEGLLGRAPDAAGAEEWLAVLNAGTSLVEVATRFLGSAEYQAKHGVAENQSPQAFVDDLFRTVLNRAADPAGEAYWLGKIAGGASYGEVALGLSISAENQAQTAQALQAGVFLPNPVAADLARLYYTVLGRAPDADGLKTWIAFEKSGHSPVEVAAGMLGSSEYGATHAGTSAADFVKQVYQGALGRGPDANDLSIWQSRLEGGASRAEIAFSIADSAEAQQHHFAEIEAGWHLV